MRQKLKYAPLVLALLLPFILSIRTIDEPDFWWQIKDGQRILSEHQVPKTEDYSFTANGNKWVDGYAIGQVILYLLYKFFSAAGVEIFVGIVICSAFLIAYFALRPDVGAQHAVPARAGGFG